MRESVMILMIIGSSALFAYTLSSLFVTQSIAAWIVEIEVNRWVLMAIINGFLLVAGCFLPPVAIILMTAPVLLPLDRKSVVTGQSVSVRVDPGGPLLTT